MEIYTITKAEWELADDKRKAWRYPGVTGPGQYTWHEANYIYYPVQSQDDAQHDFDSGLGIGGLGRHKEKPIIPTVAQMERIEQLETKATTCRRCGQNDVFDGAMFTTGGGNVCDDCF